MSEFATRVAAEVNRARESQPTMSQETINRLQDAIENRIALKEQAKTDQLKEDLKSELKVGHPTARLAELLGAIAEQGKQTDATNKQTQPKTVIEQFLKAANEPKKDDESEDEDA